MTINNAERFEQLLAALERELIEATDEEILEAASDLGMNPAMRGSAAFFGVTTDLRALIRLSAPSGSSGTPGARRRLKDDPPSRS
jgi:hypothetical protein